MGCTPSKAAVIYTRDQVCRDLDTCSTFVPSLKSSVSTPESPRLCADTSNDRQTFLSVPCRDVHGRSGSQPSHPEPWSSHPEPWSSAAYSSHGAGQLSVKPRSPTPDLHADTEGCWTA